MAKNNTVYGYAAVREDGRIKGHMFGKWNEQAQEWCKNMVGGDIEILFSSHNGCGMGNADAGNLPINNEFPPHRGTVILRGDVKEIQGMLQQVGGDANYYDMLDRLAASGVPVYR